VNGNRRSRRLRVVAGSESLLSSAGGSLLIKTARAIGLSAALTEQLRPCRAARAQHDPGKIVLDLLVAIALGGDCLADVAVVRSQPQLFGTVASDPTVSRLISALADDADAALAALRRVHRRARATVWAAQDPLPSDGDVVIDVDATLVDAHSEKEGAQPTFKRGFGFSPLCAFVDHGAQGTGECLAALLRPGKANANNAADHIAVLSTALAQLPDQLDRSRLVIRGDSGAGTHEFVDHLHALGLRYSVGIAGWPPVLVGLDRVPRQAWRAALDSDGRPRDGAQVADLTRWIGPSTGRPWPADMRIIARRERPHPGAQLRITDRDGWRITVFATNIRGPRLAELELQHRQRARAEDRIRVLKDTGLRNLPLHGFTANEVWLQLVLLASDLLTWTQLLAFPDTPVRRWEPKRLRLRLLHVAGRLVRTGRREHLRLPRGWPWTDLLLHGHHRLAALAS
jgi:hypothetical protein